MAEEIAARLAKQYAGQIAAFTLRSTVTGEALGMTTYLHLNPTNWRLKIGSTWMRRSAQGTGANAEAKLLLLQHAFETLGCEGVEFRAHHINLQSRVAIEKLGARLDGGAAPAHPSTQRDLARYLRLLGAGLRVADRAGKARGARG